MGDLNPVLERIIALRQSIVDDGIANGVPFHLNDQRTLIERLRSEGTSFIKVTLPLLGKALDMALVSGELIVPQGFKLRRDTRLPAFCGRIFDTIFESSGALRSQPCLRSVYFLRQYLLLDGKLITEPTIEQENIAINEFVTRQCLLRQRPVPIEHPVIERAQRLLTRVLSGLDLSDIQPGHGPGGVAEKLDRVERWGFDTWPKRAERYYPYSVYGTPSFLGICEMGPPKLVDKSSTRCCLVPKDFKGPRLISAESAATQYLQQGQMRKMMRYIDRHWLLSRSIQLEDQTFNQKMCQKSYDNGLCTLDLSNASDNVSAVLVWHLLRGVPRLRSQLFATRSQTIQFVGERVVLASFSPMGSAVCFPVETLVFWSLSMASIRYVHSQWAKAGYGSSLPSLKESASSLAVFGDDIIIPDYARDTLINALEAVGCSVNRSKTCYATPFRESCGSEWYNGIDVSITRNKRYHYDSVRNIVTNPVLLDLQRKFFLQGLERTAALCRRWAQEIAPTATIHVRELCPKFDSYFAVGSTYCRYQLRSTGVRRQALEKREESRLIYECPDGSASASPSGISIYVRHFYPFDRYCAALGWDTTLDCGVPRRYNKDLQRIECRLPTVFQQCREWPQSYPSRDSKHLCDLSVAGGQESSVERYRGIKPRSLLRLKTGYPRLLARVLGDYVERIAIRNLRFKMAWSAFPISDLSI